ncbi:MAG TPA: hypothetical protein VNN79_11600, partial [Actinomycetota bacterium]|nr:hypothetical protein [Actinomycetota bacterium]
MRDDFDLRERFRGLDRLDPAEDVWAEAERRRPGSVRTAPSSQGRLAAAVLALIVAAAGVLIAVRAFRSAAPGPGTETPPAVTNGPIWFRIGGGDGPSWTDSVEPDGTDRTTVFGPDSGIHADLIAFSPDGSRIAFDHGVTEQYGIETAGLDGSGVVRLTSGPNDSWPSWSPDGTRIVFSGTGDRPESQRCVAGDDFHCPTDIYAVAADGGSPVRLTSDPDPEFAPAWSPDGSRIAFLRTLPGTNRTAIFSMAADGSDVRRLSSADGGSDFAPSWAPDGSRLVFAAIRDENWGIWMVDADGTNEHMILGGSGWHAEDPRWSPDGRLIAFVGNPDTGDYSPDDALYVMRQGGSDVTRLATAPGYGVAGDLAWQPGTVGRSAPTAPATPLSPDPQPSAAASCEPAPLFGLHEQCFDPNSDPFHVDGASEVTFAQAEASADFPI